VAVLAGSYFAWFRNSSWVAVTKVEVTGLSSPDTPRITDALTKAATTMSTLNVDTAKLEKAVAGFPTVEAVSADADFPHGLTISVDERPPVLLAQSKGESVAVGPDGVLLPGLELGDAAKALPVLEVDGLPASGKLEDGALSQALVLGAAPAALRPLIEGVSIEGERGVEVVMRGGIPVRFGTPELAAEKWAAAAAVLADPKTETLTYVDVRVPERPALGGAATPPAAEEADPAAVATDPAAVATDPAAVEPAPATTDTVDPGL
jgi:cell division protein FtsQ